MAFGSTRRVKGKVDSDDTLRHLVEAERRHGVHRRQVRGTTTSPRRSAPRSTRAWRWSATRSSSCAARACEVLFDAEHFFDGYKRNPEFALRVLEAAATNGREPPRAVRHQRRRAAARGRARSSREVVELLRRRRRRSRVHLHDDAGTGVANALAGVRGGATQVQGTINGYGERTGNCNLTTIIPNLTLKMGVRDDPARPARAAHAGRAPHRRAREHAAQPAGRVRRATRRSRTRPGCTRARSRSGPTRTSTSSPDVVGNGTRFVVSELAGKSTLGLKAKELGLELDGPQLADVVETLKRLEHEGYHFEVADGSLELLMRRATGWEPDWFAVESFRVITDDIVGVGTLTDKTARDGDDRGDGQGARRRPARGRDRRGQRSGERARHRAARARSTAASPRSSACTSPTTRCACSTRTRAPAR